ncbi:hypothetical protein PR048_029940 [Dryococelus australis]|uniref:Endonuclease/exonuclease/phosphatase domain-containing protein n=1 Tax=Dryococelus australis TaxID=614101 RepID=A0ABQ9GBF8_9NEOP|nr:hypothetical protein PR048_029940 [Dryococelus australis]
MQEINTNVLLTKDKVFLQCFSIHHKDRNLTPIVSGEKHTSRRGGGVALAIRTNIKHKVLPIPDLVKIEAIAASLTIKGKQCTIVIIEPWDLNKLIRLSTFILALGDLNAKHPAWNCIGTTSNGQTIFIHQEHSPYMICAPYNPTHYPDASIGTPDILDITIYKNENLIYELAMHSDHLPVIATIEYAETGTHKQKPTPNYHKANSQRFNKAIHNSLDLLHKINTTEELEESIITLTKAIHTTVKNTIPHRVKKIRLKDSLPEDVKKLITKCNHVRLLWQRNRLRQHNTEINRLQKAIKEQLTAHRAMLWDDKIAALNLKDNSLWYTTKRLTRQTLAIPPLQDPQNCTASSPQEKADLLAATLELAIKPNINSTSPDQIATIGRHTTYLLIQSSREEPLYATNK